MNFFTDNNLVLKIAVSNMLIYCSLFLFLFFDPTKDLFELFSETSQYLAMIFHGASAICLLRIKKYTSEFQIPEWTIVVYLMLVCLIVITSFFPPAPGQLKYYIPNVVSITATLLGGIIWLCRVYPENPQDSRNPEDPGSERSETSEGLEPSETSVIPEGSEKPGRSEHLDDL
ncbi:3328_t:CDS:2 [Gigaspora rosea]|nr:3328_t:CDS:2 [Gigaspora rosea]